MTPSFFFVMPDANFAPILAAEGPLGTNVIQGYVSMGGNTYYITSNLTPPSGTNYACRMNSNGGFIVSQSKKPALTPAHTFFGWDIPA